MSVVISFNISCVSDRLFPKCYAYLFFLVLAIFNKGAYLTFKSIFHKALNLF